ncbi:hypothetical protein CIB95_09800 [Lottiidibacillus patelloidae]|uniref:Uncharacterized protein n=2 Tax=Lottiidibacillus patelloidae TaxID=2670334 RepID=A0A263BTR1_9BACI|nr:hypothetical protein [Lottiidibacillus patelloidae]OZM57100.1 hypothetical protein CIB95_09800 [Lottiidibacillus patelloidae]
MAEELSQMIGQEVLVVTEAPQLNLLGQTFRPIFCGTVNEVDVGHITLFPVIIKMVNAPFYQFPLPLSIPLDKLVAITSNFDCDTVFPLT